jgi:hypothetical protein
VKCREHRDARGKVLSLLLNWLLRGLTIIAGVIAVTLVWPIARAAWVGQPADAVIETRRGDRQVTMAEYRAAIDAETRAIEIDPTAPRYLIRSYLLATAALLRTNPVDAATRNDWLRRARADMVTGLAGSPARGIDWLRAGVVQLALDGPSPMLVALLSTSLEMARHVPQTFEVRLRLILDCWPLLNDRQKEYLRRYVVMTWRESKGDRRFFAYTSSSEADYLIINWLLREEPGALQEFAELIRKVPRE